MGGIAIATSTKRGLKKFMHENAVTLVAAGLLIVILGILLLSRYGDLYSIRDIANINPLITRGNAELIAVNVNGVIKIIKDDDQATTKSDEKATDEKTSSTQTGSGTGNGGSSGGSSTSGTSGGSGNTGGGSTDGGGSPGNNPPPGGDGTQTTFTPSVTSLKLTHTSQPYDEVKTRITNIVISCKKDYTFSIEVKATSGKGTVDLKWGIDNDNPKNLGSIELSYQGQKTISYTVPVGPMGSHTFKVYIFNAVQKEVPFTHSC